MACPVSSLTSPPTPLMNRSFYLDLAASGMRMPIGTHLALHKHADADAIMLDGERLGAVVADAARCFRTPLAMPLMDLTLEKAALLSSMGVPEAEHDCHHLDSPRPVPAEIPLTPRMVATCGAIRHVARCEGLVPMGMGIGPFSLTTKLLSDPITPVFLAGTGATTSEEPEIALLEQALVLSEAVITRYLDAQMDAGAKALIICEPAANTVYFSPKQLEDSYEVFERFVMEPMRRLVARLRGRGVDLVFHDCGELTSGMISRFASLDSAILSLGSSRKLWEDAVLIPKETVLYGNLPTKRFYASQLSREEVSRMAEDLVARMREVGHPFILGSECDVLSVPGSENEILGKVEAFMRCGCGLH